MPRSIKAHPNCFDTLRIAIKRNGFQTQRALSERAGYSLATVKKFLGGKPVDYATFTELCDVLNLDWEEIADLGIAPQADKASKAAQPASSSSKSPQIKWSQDWGGAVDVSVFYGREAELKTLEAWIVSDRCRLIALCGLGGMGKTALTAKLAHRVEDQFDYLIWRSLKNAPSVQDTVASLLNFFLEQPEMGLPRNEATDTVDAQLRQLINCMRAHRCLVVLDNIESLFEEGDTAALGQSPSQGSARHSAGTYRTGYEGYSHLFKTIGETTHNSCLLITTRELPKEITTQAGDTLPTRYFQLSGLPSADGQAMLQALGEFTGSTSDWETLIQAYSGNPLALKMIASAVRDYFEGSLADFLLAAQQDSLILGDVKQLLARQVSQLTPLEEEIMYWLAINREPVPWQTIQSDLVKTVPLNKVLQAIDSLERRSLLERKKSKITQQAVIMEFFTDEMITRVSEEVLSQKRAVLRSHALVKASSRDYITQAQTRLILQPVADRLIAERPDVQALATTLMESLSHERNQPATESGYVGGNVITLLRHLNVDLHGYDFSELTLWQARLQGLNLHDVSFAGSDLSNSVFNQPFGSIRTMAFSPKKEPAEAATTEILATGDTNGEIWLWQTTLSSTQSSRDIGAHVSTLKGHENWVCAIAFSPDGKWLLSGGADRMIKLWNVETSECFKTLAGHGNWVMSVVFSPDGTTLASASADRTIKLWDMSTGECLRTLEGHQHGVWSAAFSPDGKTLASASADRTIKLWDVSTGECVNTLAGHEHGVWSVAFSPDGKTLASGSADQTVRLWVSKTGKCDQVLKGHRNWVWMVAFSPDGKTLASGSADQTVRLWALKETKRDASNAKAGKAAADKVEMGQCLRILTGHSNWVWSVAFSSDGNYLTSGSEDRTMRLWNISSGQCLKQLQGNSNWVWSVAFSSDGKTLASGQGDRLVHLWDTDSQTPLETLSGAQKAIWSVAFSPDDRWVACGNEEGKVNLWDISVAKNRKTHRLAGHTKSIWSVAFDPKGKTLASGSADHSIKLWDIHTKRCAQTLTGHKHWVCSVAYHPERNLLASGSYDRTIKLWDLDTGECTETWTGHTSGLWCIAFSPKGDFLASSSIDQTIRLWNVDSGECEKVLTGHENWVMAVAVSPDGRWVASGSADHTLRLWDTRSGKLVHTLKGHSNSVWSVAFSPDGQLLASGSDDKTIKLWSVDAGTCLNTLKNKEPYEGLDITGVVGLTKSEISTLEQLGAVAH
ncbi:MAG: NB-ARC domain-containing protein [Cyanobacteria bacterium J06560_6]